MQEDEGFDNNEKLQFVEFNYQPLSMQLELRKYKQRALQREGDGEKYLPIRDECRQECSQSLIVREISNIVFNNFNQEVGLQENQIIFDTDFQSSNLEIVIRRKYLEYELYLRPDTNTCSYFQWFFFKVKCVKARKVVTFTIKNFVKANMLYVKGLKPFYRSNRGREDYVQLQTDVKFYENECEQTYSLKFSYCFEYDGQLVELCSQPPYTYTRMIDKSRHSKAEVLTLCKSPLHKKVPYLIYNSKKSTKAIGVVLARQHPGETGFLNKLQKDLSDSITWIIVPMMNVDGVILGNTRTGIAGYDYNRFWNTQELLKKQKNFPEIIAVIQLIKNLRRRYPKKIKLFLDLHGHSSQPNVFSYGPPHEQSSQYFYLSRVFPQLMSRCNQNFRNQQCSYVIRQDKKNTARSLIYNYFNIPFSYTIQGSFGLMQDRNVAVPQFLKVGEDLAHVAQEFICNYLVKDKNAEISPILDYVKEKYKQNMQEAEEFDSDSEKSFPVVSLPADIKEKSSKIHELVVSGQQCKYQQPRVITQVSVGQKECSHESSSLHILRADRTQQSSNIRYRKTSERKRNQTEIQVSRQNKISLLPKIKQSFSSRPKFKSNLSKQTQNSMTATTETPMLINIKEIQKRLYRLKNSRIGKKILIINAYAV